MPGKKALIPVNKFGDELDTGLSIERIAFEYLPELGEWEQPERHDRHAFFLLENGSVTMEIDFQRFEIHSPAVIYLHPDQVHRIINFEQVTVCGWAMDNENLAAEYISLLEDITPAAPLPLTGQTFELMYEAASVCIKLAGRKKDQHDHSVFKHQCNTLAGLVISLYQERSAPLDKTSRHEQVNKRFREELAVHFARFKRPGDYAQKLNISTPYLNECVKSATGQPVSYHIQQRVILEAKRLLYHSDRSLKEIALTVGYEDYTYFSRLFTKIAGTAPVNFRKKNLG